MYAKGARARVAVLIPPRGTTTTTGTRPAARGIGKAGRYRSVCLLERRSRPTPRAHRASRPSLALLHIAPTQVLRSQCVPNIAPPRSRRCSSAPPWQPRRAASEVSAAGRRARLDSVAVSEDGARERGSRRTYAAPRGPVWQFRVFEPYVQHRRAHAVAGRTRAARDCSLGARSCLTNFCTMAPCRSRGPCACRASSCWACCLWPIPACGGLVRVRASSRSRGTSGRA
ncbi:hypothetical protein FA95DRAFT_411302 [Auriscalpium vulgare]|uniref:Uncharacterized protein n=1 Tax=Auriscalpium vulgare TaxID=40419 RepID=A0ACB8RIF0_9AGAM|nr:hypothetical protein FA95DRAFT_411302 [Auriscalpium vulgare]